MQNLRVKPSRVSGKLNIPSSKSQTIRALLFGMMASGKSSIKNALSSPDTEAMIQAVRNFGAQVKVGEDGIEIQGVGGHLLPAENVIDAQNSGLILRFMGALAGLLPTYTILTGDHSIRHLRPVIPLLQGLMQLGACAESARQDGFAPIIIRGPIQPGKLVISGEDSQPVSALIIACSFLRGKTEIIVTNPGEKPWVDLTLSWLDKFHIPYERKGHTHYTIFGGARLEGFNYVVPADFSTASYSVAAALITGSELTLNHLDFNDPQGDKQFITVLQKMGASIDIGKNSLTIKKSSLQGGRIDVNEMIDMTPLFAVLGCFAEGPIEVFGGEIARQKESDRIFAITHELKKMGAIIEERRDGFVVHPSSLSGAQLFSHKDHRIALSLAVAALGAHQDSEILDVGCMEKTYPNFAHDFRRLGAQLE